MSAMSAMTMAMRRVNLVWPLLVGMEGGRSVSSSIAELVPAAVSALGRVMGAPVTRAAGSLVRIASGAKANLLDAHRARPLYGCSRRRDKCAPQYRMRLHECVPTISRCYRRAPFTRLPARRGERRRFLFAHHPRHADRFLIDFMALSAATSPCRDCLVQVMVADGRHDQPEFISRIPGRRCLGWAAICFSAERMSVILHLQIMGRDRSLPLRQSAPLTPTSKRQFHPARYRPDTRFARSARTFLTPRSRPMLPKSQRWIKNNTASWRNEPHQPSIEINRL